MGTARAVRERERSGRSFYAKVMEEAEAMDLEEAASVEGLDGEIAVLRLKLRQLLEKQPERADLHMRLAGTLARLVRTRYNITPEEKTTLKEAITSVLKDVAIPLGIKFLPK